MSDVVTKCRASGLPEWVSYRGDGTIEGCKKYAAEHCDIYPRTKRVVVYWQRPDLGTSGTHVVECRREFVVVDPRGGM